MIRKPDKSERRPPFTRHTNVVPLQVPPVELVYRDPVRMLRGFIRTFAKMEEYCWRWAYTPEPRTGDGEEVIEHPASARWWKEQAKAVEALGGSLLALQFYSDDTTLNNKRSRSAYPMYVNVVNGSYDLYKLLFPVSVVAYMPVLSCQVKARLPILHRHTQCLSATNHQTHK